MKNIKKIIPIQQEHIVKFPAKQFQNLICLEPFRVIEIGLNGNVRLCSCGGWMPTEIGNIFNQNIKDLLQSALSSDIRQSIINGSYEYCNEKTCGVIANNQLISIEKCDQKNLFDSEFYLSPVDITIAGDLTCNLSCPSCRTHVIKNSPKELDQQNRLSKIFADNIFSGQSQKHMTVRISTSGEVFASSFLMSFIQQIPLDNYPNLELIIQTNGLLVEKNWHKLNGCINRIKNVTITIDAARADTYEKLRRGGSWQQLLKSMKFLQDKKSSSEMTLTTRMVVQRDNYKQIKEFYDFSKNFNADLVEYSRLGDWNTYSKEEFSIVDVFNPAHAEFLQAKNEITAVKHLPDVMIYNDI